MIRNRTLHASLLCGAASAVILAAAGQANAQEARFSIDPQPLSQALTSFSEQSQTAIIFTPGLTSSKTTQGFEGAADVQVALNSLLAGTGLSWRRDGDAFVIVQQGEGGSSPQAGRAGGASTVEALIVTAQKREEDIQDVPIAISAFSQEELTDRQVAGGPDLMTQIPNMTFTKTNFTGYSIQIRGIGTQAISATTDPAVAVAFNNTPFIRNRFFEQEFFDLQRIEVLRGPQGTLYGRNATAGVVNIISQKPRFIFEAKASADVANYNSTRIEGMVNIPLVEDAVALRLAGAWTKRDGYSTNELTGNPIDGRDLWSTRLSLRIAPPEARFDATLIWEHFEEEDDRLRSGKQLCHKDVVTDVGGIPVTYLERFPGPQQLLFGGMQGTFSQGCERDSLYSQEMFQTPNGLMLPYYLPLGAVGLPTFDMDPYASATQSRDLRVIESTIDPEYRATSDIGELQISFDLTENLTLQSETAYSTDSLYSLQDFNRFNTAPGAWRVIASNGALTAAARNGVLGLDGFFCDPQLGCSDRLLAVDISSAKSRQFSQELRLSSDFDGPFNFSLGANYLRYDTEDKYYVFINSVTMVAANHLEGPLSSPVGNFVWVPGQTDRSECLPNGYLPNDPTGTYSVTLCSYIDPNPIESVNDLGHNYFLSRNPYKLISYAAFGEAYWDVTENLKVTAGLRYTVDKKDAPRIPTQLLAARGVGLPVAEVIETDWQEPTGRLTIDWKPDLAFTDETLLYGSYAHGYKAGGSNPPTFVRVYYADNSLADVLNLASVTRPKTFDAEFVDAFEIGAKNTLLDGRATLNLAAFYYDYEGYQISEIVDRSAFNRNFDAEVWGLEIEADWRPLENLKLGFKGGYQKTRIRDGEQAIDLMDRTAGKEGWVVVKPFPTQASNCVLPVHMWTYTGVLRHVGNATGGQAGPCERAYLIGVDPVTNNPYNPDNPSGGIAGYQGFNPLDASQGHNNGEGFFKDLGGNELPNAPNWTGTITADYTLPLTGDWMATLHTDLRWQSESYWRIFNDHEFSKLDEYFTMNLAAIFRNEEAGWNVMAYVKNVTDEQALTGAFLLSDDTALVTNVFMVEPRLYGLRVTKQWNGGPLLGTFGQRSGHYPFALELGGQVQRHDAPNEALRPAFLDAFAPEIDPSGEQHQDLDWGDGREIKLVYNPEGPWTASLGYRFGETNRGARTIFEGESFRTCWFTVALCDGNVLQEQFFTNYGIANLREGEEHDIVDFTVGRDLSVGLFGDALDSTVSAGLRFASFKSTTGGSLYGTPDWNAPAENWNAFKYPVPAEHTEYRADGEIDRKFEGVGPVLSWEASSRLLEDDAWGRFGLDWSVSGGVLFGEQKTTVEGVQSETFFSQTKAELFHNEPPVSSSVTLISYARTEKVTVPTLGASLGLSYTVGGANFGAGYRWERYFDAIDGGVEEHKSYDRTIDGPYLKISVGFGGG